MRDVLAYSPPDATVLADMASLDGPGTGSNGNLRRPEAGAGPVRTLISTVVSNPRGAPPQGRARRAAPAPALNRPPALNRRRQQLLDRSRHEDAKTSDGRESERERRARKRAEDNDLPVEVRDELPGRARLRTLGGVWSDGSRSRCASLRTGPIPGGAVGAARARPGSRPRSERSESCTA